MLDEFHTRYAAGHSNRSNAARRTIQREFIPPPADPRRPAQRSVDILDRACPWLREAF